MCRNGDRRSVSETADAGGAAVVEAERLGTEPSNRAAVRHDHNRVVGVRADNSPEPGEGAGAHLLGGLAARAAREVPCRPPQLGPPLLDLICCQPLPLALIDLSKVPVGDDVEVVGRGDRRGRIQRAFQIARVDGCDVVGCELGGDVRGLLPARLVELDVGVSLRPLGVVPFGGAVSDQEDGGDVNSPVV